MREGEEGGKSRPFPPPLQVPYPGRGHVLEGKGKDEIYKGYGIGALNWMILTLHLTNEINWDSIKDVQFHKSFLRFS